MAYEFNGTNQYLSVADNANIDCTGGLTAACHFKRNGSNNDAHPLLYKFRSADGGRGYAIEISSNKLFAVVNQTGNSATNRIITGATNVDQTQHHVALTCETGVNQKVFLDGAQDGINTTSIASIFNNAQPLLIGGAESTSPSYYMNGWIAEVGIWDVALTAAEIASLAKGMTCDKVRPQSLKFYAPLIRSLQDVRGGLTITNNNTATVANHPRVYA